MIPYNPYECVLCGKFPASLRDVSYRLCDDCYDYLNESLKKEVPPMNLLEKLLNAVDEALTYKTESKLQDLRRIREEIRNKGSSLIAAANAFAPENINQEEYRKLFVRGG